MMMTMVQGIVAHIGWYFMKKKGMCQGKSNETDPVVGNTARNRSRG
jgi:hypothetical protein